MKRALPFVLIVLLVGCGMTVRDTIRTTALVAGTTAHDLNNAEYDLYATGVYDAAKHKQVGATILTALKDVEAFVALAQAWPEHVAFPATVADALAKALTSLDAIANIVKGVPGSEKLMANIAKAKAMLGGGEKK